MAVCQKEGFRSPLSISSKDREKALEFKGRYCDKCVWYYNQCGGPSFDAVNIYGCPPGKIYKRDPPDGGYYG